VAQKLGTSRAYLVSMKTKLRLGLVFGSLLFCLSGCAAADGQEEDVQADVGDDSDEELTADGEELNTSCTRSAVMASVSGARRRIVERGFRWLDKGVPYSQSKSFEGYRTDCSGFISMAWELGTSQTTTTFGQGARSRVIKSSQLQPGDALNIPGRHIVMFLAKKGDSYCVLEQASTARDMQFRVRRFSGATAIRKDGL
jgi:hypothetical protein